MLFGFVHVVGVQRQRSRLVLEEERNRWVRSVRKFGTVVCGFHDVGARLFQNITIHDPRLQLLEFLPPVLLCLLPFVPLEQAHTPRIPGAWPGYALLPLARKWRPPCIISYRTPLSSL